MEFDENARLDTSQIDDIRNQGGQAEDHSAHRVPVADRAWALSWVPAWSAKCSVVESAA